MGGPRFQRILVLILMEWYIAHRQKTDNDKMEPEDPPAVMLAEKYWISDADQMISIENLNEVTILQTTLLIMLKSRKSLKEYVSSSNGISFAAFQMEMEKHV